MLKRFLSGGDMDQQMRSRAEWRSLFGDEAESALIASDPVLTAPFVYLRYKHKKKIVDSALINIRYTMC